MKSFAVVLAICCLLGASISQVVPTPSCSSTDDNNKNKFALTWLAGKNVTILSAIATPDVTTCGGILKTGTCCDVTKLVPFINAQNTAIKGKWTSYITKLSKIKNKLMVGIKKMVKKIDSAEMDKQYKDLTKGGKGGDKFKTVLALIPNSPVQATALAEFVTGFDAAIGNFKTSGKACFNTMKKFRANMVCAMCSSQALNFTNAQSSTDVNFRINMDSCNALINACYPVWKFNFQLTSILQYVSAIGKKAKADTVTVAFKSELDIGGKLPQLRDAFTACNIDATSKSLTCNTTLINIPLLDHQKNLCKFLFSMNKHNAFVEGSADVDEGMEAGDVDASVAESEKNVTARILQALIEPTIGIDFAADNTTATYNNLNADDSGLVPTDEVDTATAGDDTGSSSVLKFAYFALLGLFMFLLK